jgi:hypothetical protein
VDPICRSPGAHAAASVSTRHATCPTRRGPPRGAAEGFNGLGAQPRSRRRGLGLDATAGEVVELLQPRTPAGEQRRQPGHDERRRGCLSSRRCTRPSQAQQDDTDLAGMQDDANSPKKTQSDSPARRHKSGMKPNQSETMNGRWEEKITNQKNHSKLGKFSIASAENHPLPFFFSLASCSARSRS